MWYIYSGYVSPDNYDSSEMPCYTIEEFKTEDEVLDFKMEFDEGIDKECSHIIFRIFKGEEKKLEPVEVITKYNIV